MSEPIQHQIQPTPEEELATLRHVNGELIAKSATRKARVSELEATVAELQGRLTEASTSIHELTIGGPLRAMAESISVAPELWLEQFGKSYKVEMVKGELALLATDGKPVMKGDKPVPFEREALSSLLTDETHPQAKTFRSIIIANRASGAGGGFTTQRSTRTPAPKPSAPQFGLR